MRAAATRRTLFAGAGAVILGSGVTAGFAASVADLVPADTDAELIALCQRYIAADLRHVDLCHQQDAIVQSLSPTMNAEWNRLDDLVLDAGVLMYDLEPQIAAIPASSPAGTQAKAMVLARISRFYKQDQGLAIMRSLLADLLPAGRA